MALHVASFKGHTATVKMLIEAGANVNCKSNKGSGQYTALHSASAEGHAATVKELLAAGADVHGKIETTDTNLMMDPSPSIKFRFGTAAVQRFVTAASDTVGTASHASCVCLLVLRDCGQKGLC